MGLTVTMGMEYSHRKGARKMNGERESHDPDMSRRIHT